MLNKYFVIGVITGAHGIDGRLRVKPLTDEPARFLDLKTCRLMKQGKFLRECEVEEAGRHNNLILLRLNGVDNRDQAQALTNLEIAVERGAAIELGPDSWFIADLIGCEVYDVERALLGTVKDILQQPHHDLYVVQKAQEKDLLFPALKTILLSVQPEKGRIDVKLPDGLYEIYRETTE
ncbi:MAG TPA: 16S rRNA processing protein RimM [Clostridiaceae bacterium]|nr:16S rRNA processing protein RimM [Clostridiaceae bacterium]